MRKIQKDLLGQELGDLRSCVMKFLDVSPVVALNEIFQCSMQLFSMKHLKKNFRILNHHHKRFLRKAVISAGSCYELQASPW